MAQNVTLWGASYQNVPAVNLPKTGGGTATFVSQDELDKRTVRQLFFGNVTFTNGIGVIPKASIEYANYSPLFCSTVTSAVPAFPSGLFDGSGVAVALPMNASYSGPYEVQLLGFGWN